MVGKQKFELIWNSLVIKMASKIARLSETEKSVELWQEEGSHWNILSGSYKIRQENEKSVERISEKLEMKSKKSFL